MPRPDKSYLEVNVWAEGLGLPQPEREYYFAKPRRWQFDFAWPELRIALEIEGGNWNYRHGGKSRHTTGSGYENDCEKYSTAAALGWAVIRATTGMLKSGLALTLLEQAFALRAAESQGGY